jgi:hypothetical protein
MQRRRPRRKRLSVAAGCSSPFRPRGNVDYTLDFALTGAERFSGSTTLQFDLNDARSR